MQGSDHALGEVPFPLRSDAGVGKGAVGSLLVDAAFQHGEDGDAYGNQPAAQATEGAGVVLLGLPDFGGEFQYGGFIKTRSSWQGGAIALAGILPEILLGERIIACLQLLSVCFGILH